MSDAADPPTGLKDFDRFLRGSALRVPQPRMAALARSTTLPCWGLFLGHDRRSRPPKHHSQAHDRHARARCEPTSLREPNPPREHRDRRAIAIPGEEIVRLHHEIAGRLGYGMVGHHTVRRVRRRKGEALREAPENDLQLKTTEGAAAEAERSRCENSA